MTSVSCAMSLRGTGCFSVFGPVDTALAPAREGYGGCAGANDGPIAQRISVSREGTEQPCRSVVGRLLDAFDTGTEAACPPRNNSATFRLYRLTFALSSQRLFR
jgi:hypothetical protein